MKLNQLFLTVCFTVMALGVASAQKFLKPSFTFTEKKPSYITLMDGTEIECNVTKIWREKGLIEKIKIKVDGKKQKIEAKDIKFMYLPPSGWDKFASSYDFLHDATQWDDVDLDSDIIQKGYVYFERAEVRLKKKKTETLLMQLLNPSFSGRIKVYHDPRAKEGMGLGVAGIKVAGGGDKSYYVGLGDEIAFKLKKKKYDDEFANIFKGCDNMIKKYGDNPKWKNLEEHVYEYAKNCED